MAASARGRDQGEVQQWLSRRWWGDHGEKVAMKPTMPLVVIGSRMTICQAHAYYTTKEASLQTNSPQGSPMKIPQLWVRIEDPAYTAPRLQFASGTTVQIGCGGVAFRRRGKAAGELFQGEVHAHGLCPSERALRMLRCRHPASVSSFHQARYHARAGAPTSGQWHVETAARLHCRPPETLASI